MRLVVVHPFATIAERQRQYEDLARATGWDIHLIVPDEWRDEYGRRLVLEARDDSAVHLHGVSVRLPGNIPLHSFRRSIGSLLHRIDPDLIYVYHEPYAPATAQAFVGNWRKVRVPIAFYSSQNIHRRYPPPFALSEAAIFRSASFAITCSLTVKAVLRDKGYTKPCMVVPFSVDTERFRPIDGANGGGAELLVGYVGRLVPEKGVQTILSALALTKDRDIRLRIAGAGPAEAILRKQASSTSVSGRVQWTGVLPHDALPDFYRSLDVLVVPSITTRRWKEQFGRVVLEAAASGLCVVTSDSGELPQVIGSIGSGIVFPEGDARELAARLLDLAADKKLLSDHKHRARQGAQRFSDGENIRTLAEALSHGLAIAGEDSEARPAASRGSFRLPR